ncbi:uncharacterized protein LOC124180083 isoform X1 [Neodiprion fabricii]|uniref:uncharacterized protein LOC124180083 isoform X1 n=1 Tax=Neodiprion fabricii TaxID=2872261 RepID=UPI001ED94B75|nr:uncharacterized protein LOC124180083 isoform X1 [Neodiprion fabricii]
MIKNTFVIDHKLVLTLLLTTLIVDGGSLTKQESPEVKTSRNIKRSPLELGLVSFELDPSHGGHFRVIHKSVPVTSKSRTISTTSTVSSEKHPAGDHVLIPVDLANNEHHVIFPIVDKIHQIDPRVVVDHKELLLDHAAKVVLDQKHLVLDRSSEKTIVLAPRPLVLSPSGHRNLIVGEPNSHTVFFAHKPVLVGRNEHGTNVLVHSRSKTLVHKNIGLGGNRAVLRTPKNQIHEIIVHRHVSKPVPDHEDEDHNVNVFRSHYGGFGVGLNYGGHGAGHGFHVPVF